MTKLILFLLLNSILFSPTSQAAVLKGKVHNIKTGKAVPYATITSSQDSQIIMTNENGSFILYLEKGKTTLNCSHIAYFTNKSTIEIDRDTVEIEIQLNPSLLELPSISVYERDYDAAQRIIIEAIRNKDKILSKLNSYQFDAYTKMTIWNASNPDSLKPWFMAETQLTAYWKYPSEYKEIITARKQSANMEAENNLMSIGEVLNFNNNRIDIGTSSLVSPTAKDALDYYNYYLLDTLFYDSLAVYLLEVEPKNNVNPLFIGSIQINANTYEIMGVDFRINEGLDNPYLKKLQVKQEYHFFDDSYWMPTIIKYDGIFDIPFPLVPTVEFSYTAALQRYQFEKNYGDTIFDKYELEVDINADNYDSTQWQANKFLPLTIKEQKAYEHIDSVKQNRPLLKKLLPIIPAILFAATNMPDYFHFNRVEGAYLGIKKRLSFDDDKVKILGKFGYAFDAKLWQQSYSLKYTLSKKQNLTIHTTYHDNIQTRTTINSSRYGNATGLSLLSKHDPYDYYKETGFSLGVSFSPLSRTSVSLSYKDNNQYTLTNKTNYSLLNKDSTYRENLPIINGKLRSVNFNFQYKTTQLMKIKGKEVAYSTYPYAVLRAGIEISDRSRLKSDFDFKTIYGQFYTDRQFFGLGYFSFGIYGTTKLSGNLPPQRYTVMDFGGNILDAAMTFRTLQFTNFSGNNLLSIYYNHRFGTKLFKKSQLPLIKKIPYSLSIHGGVFWSSLKDNNYNEGDLSISQTGDKPYSEIGFSIGRLPFLIQLSFTWQLSAYDTDKFYFGIGLAL